MIEFTADPAAEALAAEAREFLAEHLPVEVEERLYRSGTAHDPAFVAAMAERGWLGQTWPVEFGGAGLHRFDVAGWEAEMRRADAPVYATSTTNLVAGVVQKVGTPEQRAELLPKVTRGEVLIVLGMTEPECGSDVAAAQTRAVRDGDEWVINGSKMFTTNAHVGDYVFLLARTDPDAPKHKGLTTFLVPLDQPGVEVQAVYTLSGERTNITYYNDARVSDAWRLGEVNGGWQVMLTSLQSEHGASFASATERLLAAAEEWAAEEVDDGGRPRLDDPAVLGALARCAADIEVSGLLSQRIGWMGKRGDQVGAEGPMVKLFSTESLVRAAQEVVEVVGPDALRSYFEPSAPAGGRIEHALRFSLGTTIYAGTSEVQRGIIAQRGLGLPRS